jgi:hypothetical protein
MSGAHGMRKKMDAEVSKYNILVTIFDTLTAS